MNTIINPINNKAYNINEPIGRDLLKQYVKNYSSGGMMRYQYSLQNPMNAYDWPQPAYYRDCERKINKLTSENYLLKKKNKLLERRAKDCHTPLHRIHPDLRNYQPPLLGMESKSDSSDSISSSSSSDSDE